MDRTRTLVVLLGVAVALIGVASLWTLLPLREWVEGLDAWMHSLGIWAPIVFCLAYVLAVMALVPASTVTLAAGSPSDWRGFLSRSLPPRSRPPAPFSFRNTFSPPG